MKRDRDVMYGLMRDLTQNQSRIYDVLQDLNGRQQQLTNQQQLNELTIKGLRPSF
jgi:hypothetical protein